MREQEDLIKRAQDAVSKVIKKKTPVSVLENKIKDAVGNFVAREIGPASHILLSKFEVKSPTPWRHGLAAPGHTRRVDYRLAAIT